MPGIAPPRGTKPVSGGRRTHSSDVEVEIDGRSRPTIKEARRHSPGREGPDRVQDGADESGAGAARNGGRID